MLGEELRKLPGNKIDISSPNQNDNAEMVSTLFNTFTVKTFEVNAVVCDQGAFESNGMFEMGAIAFAEHLFFPRCSGFDVACSKERGDENRHVFVKINACYSNLPELGWRQ